MAQLNEITLWRAPSKRCRNPLRELQLGFDAGDYPGSGLYFTTIRKLALSFEYHYQNGLQEFFMRQEDFDRLVDQKKILPDAFYPKGTSWVVPPQFIAEFDAAIKLGTAGTYQTEE